jgi:hypothetical protein
MQHIFQKVQTDPVSGLGKQTTCRLTGSVKKASSLTIASSVPRARRQQVQQNCIPTAPEQASGTLVPFLQSPHISGPVFRWLGLTLG